MAETGKNLFLAHQCKSPLAETCQPLKDR